MYSYIKWLVVFFDLCEMVLTVLQAKLVVITPNYHGSMGSWIVLYTVDDVEVRICTGVWGTFQQ